MKFWNIISLAVPFGLLLIISYFLGQLKVALIAFATVGGTFLFIALIIIWFNFCKHMGERNE